MEIFIPYMVVYFAIGLLFVFFNCFMAGYNGEEPKLSDFRDIVTWPVSLVTFLGLLSKILVVKYNTRKKPTPKQKTPQK